MFDIENVLCQNTNLVEIYFPRSIETDVVDITTKEDIISKLCHKYNAWKTTEFVSYHMNELIYVYDISNDNQIVYSKIATRPNVIHKPNTLSPIYVISYNHSKLPPYLFPCTSDIDDKTTYTISECRISNRLSIVIKTEQDKKIAFIEYKHPPLVEIKKIESSINHIIDSISHNMSVADFHNSDIYKRMVMK